jgi:hypothetical protein
VGCWADGDFFRVRQPSSLPLTQGCELSSWAYVLISAFFLQI